jgi:hypothetical protein
MKRTFYITEGYIHSDITAIQIQDYDRETKNFWIIEREGKPAIRISKDIPRRKYFDSWEVAHEALQGRALLNIQKQVEAVKRAQHTYHEVCKMTKPNYRPVGFR